MKNFNIKIRLKNPLFIASIIMSVLLPILGYMGMEISDITSWQTLGNILMNAIKNPYVLGMVVVSIYNSCIDFTTEGIKDSNLVLQKSSVKDKVLEKK